MYLLLILNELKKLYNIYGKEQLQKRLDAESFNRRTLSYYRYVYIDNVEEYRDALYEMFEAIGVLGRIYVAHEGINAQINVPEPKWDKFLELLQEDKYTKDIPLKIAIEDDGKSFLKLIVRVRNKIVADGLNDHDFDVTNVGKHLSADQFNEALNNPDTICVDMRNHYESEVGHFRNAILPDTDTFRETLPKVVEQLEDKKDKKIIMYCTGGIRCEKASAYLKHHGFKDVNQLHGGIIEYAQQVKHNNVDSSYIGSNFVFDNRLGEQISEDVISECHQCGKPSARHTNCANDDCHLLFIQCEECSQIHQGTCTPKCQDIVNLPIEEQRKLRKGKVKHGAHSVYKSRIRPKLKEFFKKESKKA
ncbi:MAG: rhodanese-related sulfurtransferase [Bacteroidia bacterium]|nr:rhodanese-related sulfurtransferase [Bacteroidia bacterium]